MEKAGEAAAVKLLNIWNPPEGAGPPVGCIATSYTFDTIFFEEECLGRFVQIESDPSGEGPAYLIEREEKLVGLAAAVVYVDRKHCAGSRNIRWDMVPVRPKGGSFHPKIVLLCWQNAIRLCISSANLTADGYRKNREIAGIIDYSSEIAGPPEPIDGAFGFLESLQSATHSEGPEAGRSLGLIDWARRNLDEWSGSAKPSSSGVEVYPVFISPGGEHLFIQTGRLLPSSPRATIGRVASPFFSDAKPSDRYYPSLKLWEIINQRGKAHVTYCILALEREDGSFVTTAPVKEIINATPKQRGLVSSSFEQISQSVEVNGERQARPFHMKSIWFESDAWVAHLIGSSNFTPSGTGLVPNVSNFEANLLFIERNVGKKRRPSVLAASRPSGEPVENNEIFPAEIIELETDEESDDLSGLPEFFSSAVFTTMESGRPLLRLTFNPELSNAPHLLSWEIHEPNIEEIIYSSEQWNIDKCSKTVTLSVNSTTPPSGLLVVWGPDECTSWWPIILKSSASLPPPEELQNLPLSLLISILTSARPVHQLIGSFAGKDMKRSDFQEQAFVDPHKRVDVSSFILQRTRRVAWALEAMRKRLNMPVVSKEQLDWRLNGPIGVVAFVNAIVGETDGIERQFLLADIAIELRRNNQEERQGCLDSSYIEQEIDKIVSGLRLQIKAGRKGLPQSSNQYFNTVLEALGDKQ